MRDANLRDLFEHLYAKYHRAEFLPGDPLNFAHRYKNPEDQEVAALLAAAFASGNIKSILAVLDRLGVIMGSSPAAWLRDRSPDELHGRAQGIHHRWVRAADVEVLLAMIGSTLRQHGTLGNLWRSLDNDAEDTVLPTLTKFVAAIQAQPVAPLMARSRSNVKSQALPPVTSILLTSPSHGSACKRMNLFLRWMVRPADGIDLGLWSSFVSSSRLVMPVDVHVLRLCRKLRLTRRNTADQRAVREITHRMRVLSPEDPCRYDFSIIRAGIQELRTR
ncbi:TIGR02757 family protein [Candidatus Sumerlaeota bacterium]|nr:TIGR02757 family protein [Candidatus Sumerlaeota bacterium]